MKTTIKMLRQIIREEVARLNEQEFNPNGDWAGLELSQAKRHVASDLKRATWGHGGEWQGPLFNALGDPNSTTQDCVSIIEKAIYDCDDPMIRGALMTARGRLIRAAGLDQ